MLKMLRITSIDFGRIAYDAQRKIGIRSEKTMDAIQIAVALHIGADAFLTNDRRLKSVTEIDVIVLKDYAP